MIFKLLKKLYWVEMLRFRMAMRKLEYRGSTGSPSGEQGYAGKTH